METSSFEKSSEEWLAELNDPRAEHRTDALTALVDSGTLNERIINELKLIARGDPDSRAQSLAKKVLKAQGIKILPVKQTRLLSDWEFWTGFFLFPILNFILSLGLPFLTLFADRLTNSLQLVINVGLLVYFSLQRKNVALGMLAAAFGFFMVIRPICLMVSLPLRCWPDGCAVPR